jgi:hypothetical protein
MARQHKTPAESSAEANKFDKRGRSETGCLVAAVFFILSAGIIVVMYLMRHG